MAALLYRLGSFAARRAWQFVIGWILILGIAVGGFLTLGGTLSTSFDIPGTASGAVVDELTDKLPERAGMTAGVVYQTTDGSPFTAEQQQAISDVAAGAEDLDGVASVVDPFDAQRQQQEQTQELADAQTQIEDGRTQLDAGQAQLDDGVAQLEAAWQQLTDARTQAEAAGVGAEQIAALDQQLAQLDAQAAMLADQQSELDASRAELEDNAAQVELGSTIAGFADGIGVVSEDGSTAIVNVTFDDPRLELEAETKEAATDYFEAAAIDGVTVDFGTDLAQAIPALFGPAEAVGLVLAAIVLLVVLGSLLAAALPIVTALVGVGIGVTASLSFSGIVDMASITPVLGVMLGLAVGIDYSLFIVYRHRKQLIRGVPVRESIGLATGTSGTAVVFAGATVIVALLALNVTGIPFLGLMGTVGAVCVAIAVLVAITLAPAILGLVGDRLLTRKTRALIADDTPHPKAHKKIAPMSNLRAVLTVLGTVVLLLILAIPAMSMRLGLPDGSSEPAGSSANQAHQIVGTEFGEGANGPLLVTATSATPFDDDDVLQLQVDVVEQIAGLGDVAAIAPIAVSDDNTLLAFQVIPEEGPNSESTELLVHEIRDLPPVDGDLTLGVAGQAASNIDISQSLSDALPIYLVVVVGLSFLIMIVVFRSLLVPIIATGGFVLSLFATYGLIVSVFQFGWGGALFGIDSTGPILSFLPVILVGILFGLAMDYQLFLASGMREAFVHGSPAKLAVAQGFRAGRSVVSAAALIMVAVFGGFAFADSIMIRSIGFGLAFGVLLDAFVVRMLLMPALMHLLGRSAWWLPRWLDRALPNVDLEGASLERDHPGMQVGGVPRD